MCYCLLVFISFFVFTATAVFAYCRCEKGPRFIRFKRSGNGPPTGGGVNPLGPHPRAEEEQISEDELRVDPDEGLTWSYRDYFQQHAGAFKAVQNEGTNGYN